MGKKSYEFETRFSDIEKELEERENWIRAIHYKICSRCGERKPVSKFTIDKRNTDGRIRVCKVCRSRESLKYYYQDRERILIRVKEYQENNKEDRRKYFQDYRKDHKEHLKKLAGKWYKKNKKEIKKRNLKYYEENKEACQVIRELWREANKEKIKKYNWEYWKLKVSLKKKGGKIC
ncbi:hypothetical protein ES703_37441 [subsurface metagenome]